MDLKLKNNNKLKLHSYTELEYIESTGTQGINLTGLDLSMGFRIKTRVVFKDVTTKAAIFGSYESSKDSWIGCSNSKLAVSYDNLGNPFEVADIIINTPYDIDATYYATPIDDTASRISWSVVVLLDNVEVYNNNGIGWNFFVSSLDYSLFVQYNRGKYSKIQLGETYIYDNDGILARHFIPAKRDLDNVLGMYDILSGTFYTNSGSGTFTAGTSVGSIFKKELITYTTTAYLENCPRINGYDLLKQCTNLTRVRLDIGNISGSLDELMSYSSLNGFNDNYKNQTKPRLVGTWTINDWYTQEQLDEAQAAFDGLTIISNSEISYDIIQEGIIHILSTSVPLLKPTFITSDITKIYIGAGYSSDDALKNNFASNSMWSSYASLLDTWYNYLHYLHPTT